MSIRRPRVQAHHSKSVALFRVSCATRASARPESHVRAQALRSATVSMSGSVRSVSCGARASPAAFALSHTAPCTALVDHGTSWNSGGVTRPRRPRR